jgi:hypothetical protein
MLVQEFELARDEECISRLAGPATNVDNIETVVDEGFDGNELRKYET